MELNSLTVKCMFSSHISIYWIVKLSILSFKTNQTLYYLHHLPIKMISVIYHQLIIFPVNTNTIYWEIFGTRGATLTCPCTFSHLNLERLQVCIYKDIIMHFLKNVWPNSIWNNYFSCQMSTKAYSMVRFEFHDRIKMLTVSNQFVNCTEK